MQIESEFDFVIKELVPRLKEERFRGVVVPNSIKSALI